MVLLRKCLIACSASFVLASDDYKPAVSALAEVSGDDAVRKYLTVYSVSFALASE